MPKLEYFLVAEGISIDQKTNRVSVFNVFEEIQVSEFPVLIPALTGIALWNLEAEDWDKEFQAVLKIKVPDEDTPRDFRVNFSSTSDTKRHRIYMTVQSVVIRAKGTIEVELLLNGEHVASHQITVIKDE